MLLSIGAGPELELDEGSALDIGACRVGGVDLAPGDAVPDDGDPRILHAVRGFLFTCGPDHIRHPEPIAGQASKRWPLHGSLAGHKAEILAVNRSEPCLEVQARVDIRLADGGRAELRRLWRMNAATGETMLEDTLLNTGPSAFVPMWMYHMNIGARHFDDRTMLAGPSFGDHPMSWRFGDGEGHVFCVPATREADGWVHVRLGPMAGGRHLDVMFDAETLPHLQMWRNEAGHCNVIGIEPVSHPWRKRDELAAAGLMTALEPGGLKRYRLGFSFR